MQRFEQALKLVFDDIGDNYYLPTEKTIDDYFNPGNPIPNQYYGQSPKKIKFMYGTQKQLNTWLNHTKEKYPLVWLVYPITEDYSLTPLTVSNYKGVRLIFAINNSADKLVNTRLQITKPILNDIIEKFKSLMLASQFRKFIYLDKTGNVKETFYPEYAANPQAKTPNIDIWDAITFDADFHLIAKCIPNN